MKGRKGSTLTDDVGGHYANKRSLAGPKKQGKVGEGSSSVKKGLTTIAQPVDELGKQAAQLLIKQLLADDERPASETIVLPTRLIVRGSTVN